PSRTEVTQRGSASTCDTNPPGARPVMRCSIFSALARSLRRSSRSTGALRSQRGTRRAEAKSSSTTRSPLTITLAGCRSLWVKPAACRCATAARSWRKVSSPTLRLEPSGSPGTNSIASDSPPTMPSSIGACVPPRRRRRARASPPPRRPASGASAARRDATRAVTPAGLVPRGLRAGQGGVDRGAQREGAFVAGGGGAEGAGGTARGGGRGAGVFRVFLRAGGGRGGGGGTRGGGHPGQRVILELARVV